MGTDLQWVRMIGEKAPNCSHRRNSSGSSVCQSASVTCCSCTKPPISWLPAVHNNPTQCDGQRGIRKQATTRQKKQTLAARINLIIANVQRTPTKPNIRSPWREVHFILQRIPPTQRVTREPSWRSASCIHASWTSPHVCKPIDITHQAPRACKLCTIPVIYTLYTHTHTHTYTHTQYYSVGAS